MNDQQLLRYARHIMLEEFGFDGQERLLSSRVLIVGLGGLGSPALAYLASAGVGTLDLVDDDRVEISNLQRQIIHNSAKIGMSKVASASDFALSINPDLIIYTYEQRPTDQFLRELITKVDLVLDCTDNFRTRQQINKICHTLKKPWVSAAATRYNGQVTVFDPRDQACPCYACQYPPEDNLPTDNCATLGVFAPLLGVIGAMQASEAIKLLLKIGQPLTQQLLLLDIKSMQWQRLRLRKDPQCLICSST